ncbi:unnamed protein product [Paramecium pentaurelia]|uniref:Uncharacterized protein n=1 Tax=Paramecium pentaurelia TaxID=43138 RepID=A0A8S1T7L5_9CILI|nr:unnamed protein product [Paramecium pentaurelia]
MLGNIYFNLFHQNFKQPELIQQQSQIRIQTLILDMKIFGMVQIEQFSRIIGIQRLYFKTRYFLCQFLVQMQFTLEHFFKYVKVSNQNYKTKSLFEIKAIFMDPGIIVQFKGRNNFAEYYKSSLLHSLV